MHVHVRANVEGLPREAASDTCDLNPRKSKRGGVCTCVSVYMRRKG